jgi:5-methylcytosine-specific restriction endonuclease McrA
MASRRRIETRKATIAEYWLGSSEGLDRLRENAALIDLGEPHCFACGFDATEPEEPPEIWSVWDKAALDRCHLVPRSLGGDDLPSNLVLLCRSCHRDAPNVGDPTYMLRWITGRESYGARIARLANGALGVDELKGLADSFDSERVLEAVGVVGALLRAWTGTHGGYMNDSTLEAVIAEAVCRAGGRST